MASPTLGVGCSPILWGKGLTDQASVAGLGLGEVSGL